MRDQTRVNRALGINAGKARREAAGNREETSQARRSGVFRQDVEHAGNQGDPIKAEQMERAARTALVILALHETAPNRTRLSIAQQLGTSDATVSRMLLDFAEGRRDRETGRLITTMQGRREERLAAFASRVVALRREGATYQEIMRETKLSQSNVAAILVRNGLIKPQPRRRYGG